MGIEIERKFLVISEAWRAGAKGVRMTQGFLCRDAGRVVRVRRAGEEAFMTVKGRATGISRTEIEFPIAMSDAEALLALCLPALIEKTRYRVEYRGHTWEVDEFHGLNAGLIVAEIELPSEDTRFDLPPWVGAEVSDDRRYANSQLSQHPFCEWGKVV
jgi:CYTH domain-containing protein